MYHMLEDIKAGGLSNLEPIERVVIFYIITITLFMLVCSGILIFKSIKHRKCNWKATALIPHWIGWLGFLFVVTRSTKIGEGIGLYSDFDNFLRDNWYAGTLFSIVYPIYLFLAIFSLIFPWVLLISAVKGIIVKIKNRSSADL
jgi:uncharacterized protein involved in cysteine biosynthesis